LLNELASKASIYLPVESIFIKLNIADKERSETGEMKMKGLDILTKALVIIGALNWGLVGAAKFDLVATVVGLHFGQTNGFSSVVYLLVGVSGLYQAITWKRNEPRALNVPSNRPFNRAA